MKRKAIFAAMAATVAVTGTATTSQAGSNPVPEVAQVTVIHAATFSADSPFTVTVCANGSVVDNTFEVGDQLGPIALPAGPLDVAVFPGTVESCDATTPAISGTIPVEAGDDFAIVAIWGPNGPDVLTFDYDRSCVDPGEARVAAVHSANFAEDSTVDVWAGPAGGEISPLIPGFELATYAGPLTVPAGAYDIAVFPAGADPSGEPAIAVDGLELAEGTSTVIYAIGGNDGPLGAFALADDLAVCEVTTETTVPPTPTTEAPGPESQGGTATPATPVAGNANFTG